MSTKNDGGSAFPIHELGLDEGMSLRAWLAGQALAGWAAGRNETTAMNSNHEQVAKACVKYADALIAELQGNP